VIPSTKIAPETKELVAKALRSAADVPLRVAPRQVKHGGSSDCRESTSSEDVKKELVPGLEITATTPCPVDSDGILRRRPPEESISKLPADTHETMESNETKNRIMIDLDVYRIL
jgi:hypothetical protein